MAEPSPERFRTLLGEKVGREAEEVLMTTAERLLAEGEARGRVQGRAEGEVLGRMTTLMKLLKMKFGPLPGALELRMQRATPGELDLWTERLVNATSLQDVLD